MHGHLSDEELLAAAGGEVSGSRMAAAQAHLAECSLCSERRSEFDKAAEDLRTIRDGLQAQLPPIAESRARLLARLDPPPSPDRAHTGLLQLACVAAAVLIAVIALRLPVESGPEHAAALPDPGLTPGAVLPVLRADLCSNPTLENAPPISGETARAIFSAYGIRDPEPRAYEVDYLITPALGGSSDPRNFWPQSYRDSEWNAHIKDAIEDRLYSLVCAGEIDLEHAQRELSRDWVAAYKKHFRTSSPLRKHAGFLKDRPWE